MDLQHEGRAITYEQIIQSYNTDGKQMFVDFCRQELEESRRSISEKHYKTSKYQIDKLAGYHPDLTLPSVLFFAPYYATSILSFGIHITCSLNQVTGRRYGWKVTSLIMFAFK